MLSVMRLVGVMLVVAGALWAAPGVAAPPPPPKPAPTAAPVTPPPPPMPQEQMKTSDQVKRESVEGAVTQPLRDFNVVRTKIPDVLLMALADPYERPPKNWRCPQLIALVRPLDAALGPDIDLLPAGDEDLMDRSRSTALGAAADLASDAIPFRGWVRKLTGAERHDKLVQSAIVAGNTRRGYLKGLGEARGCNPPATPSHERAGLAEAVADKRSALKPMYPIRQPAPVAQQMRAEKPQPDPR